MKKRAKKQKGQIAIFLLMVFQLLFILFAMTVNVALTVHDKINLQNSVDLAAIYGAKKQAEVLNAIAHINFQMRQNYKLLAWRFRILGTMTITKWEIIGNEWCPQNRFHHRPGQLTNARPCEDRYAICFSADIWTRGITTDDTQNFCLNTNVTIPNPPDLGPPVYPAPWNDDARERQFELIDNLQQDCNAESFINWLMSQVFLSHFRLDQKDRKMMIHAIYDKTLKQGRDLDGNSIEEGVRKTFEKNLTLINKQSSKNFKTFNSLKDPSPVDIKNFLKPEHIFPILEYLYFGQGGGVGNACSNLERRFSDQFTYPNKFNRYSKIVQDHQNYVEDWLFLFNYNQINPTNENFITPLTLGYKKSDMTVYYGVSATLTQSTFPQLFSPSSSLELKASAFAKPFGGRIGPPRNKDPRTFEAKPNYSRYPGDPHGLRHIDAHDEYYLQKRTWKQGKVFFNINNYADLASGDALAASVAASGGSNFVLRLMEMMAISPNIFELLNYSISNNYMETYFPKICKLIGPGGGCASGMIEITAPVQGSMGPGYIRGDFGHPHTESYTRKNQTVRVSSFVPFFFFPPNSGLVWNHTSAPGDSFGGGGKYGFSERPPYLVKDPSHFLSGFVPTTSRDRYNDYSTPDPKNFMKCYKPTQSPYHIPSGCAVGGRSGYSVKLISCETVDIQPGLKPTNMNPDYCQ